MSVETTSGDSDASESTNEDESTDETFEEFVTEYSEEELSTLLLVLGVILFLFPEPVTSIAGIVMILIGVGTWFSDWLWG